MIWYIVYRCSARERDIVVWDKEYDMTSGRWLSGVFVCYWEWPWLYIRALYDWDWSGGSVPPLYTIRSIVYYGRVYC